MATLKQLMGGGVEGGSWGLWNKTGVPGGVAVDLHAERKGSVEQSPQEGKGWGSHGGWRQGMCRGEGLGFPSFANCGAASTGGSCTAASSALEPLCHAQRRSSFCPVPRECCQGATHMRDPHTACWDLQGSSSAVPGVSACAPQHGPHLPTPPTGRGRQRGCWL